LVFLVESGGEATPRGTIVYWAATIIVAAMLLLDVIYLAGSAQMVAAFNHLGYPQHFRLVQGVARPAAGAVLLLPGLRLLKEWAYAGVSFAWSMAFLAHWLAATEPWRSFRSCSSPC
jgi:hypothetical protein